MPPTELWGALSRTDQFTTWWTWLRIFEATGLEKGAVARCVVRAPLPYSLHFHVHVDDVVPAELVDAHVEGDLSGSAQLEIAPGADRGSSEARLLWSVEVCTPLLRTAARVARPVMEWGHEWVVTNGVTQFRQRAFEA